MSVQVRLFGQADSKLTKVADRVEEIVGAGFGVRTFAENFEVLAQSLGGVARLKSLVLELAVRGRLLPRGDPQDHVAGSSNDELFPVPGTWSWARTGDVFEVAGGIQKTPGRAPRLHHFPYLRVENVQRGRLDLERIERFELAEGELERRRLVPGDLLVVEGNGSATEIGRCAIWGGEIENCVHQNHIIRCRPVGSVSSPFALLFLNSPTGTAEMRQLAITTSGLYSLSVGKIRGIVIPVPPLAEQKRIVAKVDQLMALCDELEARQTKKRDIGTRLTKSALEALTSAEGPEEFDVAWKRVVDNFGVLIDRAEKVGELKRWLLQLAVTGALSRGGTGTWRHGAVADVAECRLGKMLDKAKNRGTLRPYLRNTNVHWFRLELGDIKQMPFEDHECEEYELRTGDLVVCEGGHGIGRTAVWAGEMRPMMFQKALHRVRPKAIMNSVFLAYQFKVAADTGVMSRYFTGAGIPHLTGRRLAEMAVNIPPIDEQRSIVARVEQLMKLCDDLEASLRRAEDRASKLVEAVVSELVA